jgi:hypothetical protein
MGSKQTAALSGVRFQYKTRGADAQAQTLKFNVAILGSAILGSNLSLNTDIFNHSSMTPKLLYWGTVTKNASWYSVKITHTFLSTRPLLGTGKGRYSLCDVRKMAQELSICDQMMLEKLT